MMNDYWGRGTTNGNDMGGIIFMLFILVLVLVGVFVLVHYLSHTNANAKPDDSSLDLLKKRYAQGEIDTKEFEEKRKVLNG